MKKILIHLLAAILTTAATVGTVSAQLDQFANQGATLGDLFSGDEQTTTAEGDMNKDGIKDLVIGVPEGIAIYWGKNGGYTLYNTYSAPQGERENAKITRSHSITSKGVLRIENTLTITDPEQGSIQIDLIYLMRYQDNDFYMIGGKLGITQDKVYIGYSINTLTNTIIAQDKNNDAVSDPLKIPEIPLKSISEIQFGNPKFFDQYIDSAVANNDDEISKDFFAFHILKQMAELEDQNENPSIHTESAKQLVGQLYAENGMAWGKKAHQYFNFYWQHDDQTEVLMGLLDCFPLKDGGYFVMFVVVRTIDEKPQLYNYYYVFKDNILSKSDKYLPKFDIYDFYSNADQFPQKVWDETSEAIKYPLIFYIQNDKTLTITPNLGDENVNVSDALECLFMFHSLVYIWEDGQFVRKADNKPIKADLTNCN